MQINQPGSFHEKLNCINRNNGKKSAENSNKSKAKLEFFYKNNAAKTGIVQIKNAGIKPVKFILFFLRPELLYYKLNRSAHFIKIFLIKNSKAEN